MAHRAIFFALITTNRFLMIMHAARLVPGPVWRMIVGLLSAACTVQCHVARHFLPEPVSGCIDGWTETAGRWANARTDGQTDGRVDGQSDGRTDGRTDDWVGGRTEPPDVRTNGQTKRRTEEWASGRSQSCTTSARVVWAGWCSVNKGPPT